MVIFVLKNNKKYSPIFIFRVIWENSPKITLIFDEFLHITRKIKIGEFFLLFLSTKMTITQKIKIRILFFLSIQPIPDPSWMKDDAECAE